MFLAVLGAPAALQMADVIQRDPTTNTTTTTSSPPARQTAYSPTLDSRIACPAPQMRRQWATYLYYVGQEDEGSVTDVLRGLDWPNLGNACVVEVDALSCVMASALAKLYPALRFVVQMAEQSHGATFESGLPDLVRARITVHQRVPGTPQMVTDAAVYIFRLPQPCPTPGVQSRSQSLPLRIISELHAHLGVLRANLRSVLILTARPLPEPGSIDPRLETLARLSELSRLQLTNERTLRVDELIQLLESVGDEGGRLMMIRQLLSSDKTTVALVVHYQPRQQELLSL